MKNASLSLLVTLGALAATVCASHPAPQQPEIVSRGTREGHGYPFGSSASGDAMTLTRAASSATYGYSPEEPVVVGSGVPEDGPGRERLYLRALRGPQGQPITFERRGSCCGFETENSPLGGGLLDVYELTYEGLGSPILLYLNMYDPGEALIPQRLTARN